MKRRRYAVFATVGTTSFDDFVESLCSLHFLTAMAHYHPRPRQVADVDDDDDDDVDDCDGKTAVATHSSVLTIQYGGGKCPSSFIPPCLIDAPVAPVTNETDDIEDGSGSMVLSFPIHGDVIPPTLVGHDATSSPSSDIDQKHHRRRLLVQWYRYRSSLVEEMMSADAIFCHAGAGTLLEALEISSSSYSLLSSSNNGNDIHCNTTDAIAHKGKIIVAVINTKLMDNHQSELAIEFENLGHVYVSKNCMMEWIVSLSSAREFWEYVGTRDLVPFYTGGRGRVTTEDDRGAGHVSGFQSMVDRVMGFGEDRNGKISSKML